MVDAPKNAVPVGTVAGIQLAAVLKSELAGAVDQVASWAWAGIPREQGRGRGRRQQTCAHRPAPAAEFLNAVACLPSPMRGPRQRSPGTRRRLFCSRGFPATFGEGMSAYGTKQRLESARFSAASVAERTSAGDRQSVAIV